MLTYGGHEMASYPMHVFNTWLRRIFIFIVPLAFVNYFPVIAALDRVEASGFPAWVPYLSPVICLCVVLGGIKFFGRGLKRYESTGS